MKGLIVILEALFLLFGLSKAAESGGFSSDGTLKQTMVAQYIVDSGNYDSAEKQMSFSKDSTIAVKFGKAAVVISLSRRVPLKLSVNRILKFPELVCSIVGLHADRLVANRLVKEMCEEHFEKVGYPISSASLALRLADDARDRSLHMSSVRPLAFNTIILGREKKQPTTVAAPTNSDASGSHTQSQSPPHENIKTTSVSVFRTDAAGNFYRCQAACIGSLSEKMEPWMETRGVYLASIHTKKAANAKESNSSNNDDKKIVTTSNTTTYTQTNTTTGASTADLLQNSHNGSISVPSTGTVVPPELGHANTQHHYHSTYQKNIPNSKYHQQLINKLLPDGVAVKTVEEEEIDVSNLLSNNTAANEVLSNKTTGDDDSKVLLDSATTTSSVTNTSSSSELVETTSCTANSSCDNKIPVLDKKQNEGRENNDDHRSRVAVHVDGDNNSSGGAKGDHDHDFSTVWTHNVTDVHPDMACCLNIAWSGLKECIGLSELTNNYTIEISAVLDTDYDISVRTRVVAVDKDTNDNSNDDDDEEEDGVDVADISSSNLFAGVDKSQQLDCRGIFYGPAILPRINSSTTTVTATSSGNDDIVTIGKNGAAESTTAAAAGGGGAAIGSPISSSSSSCSRITSSANNDTNHHDMSAVEDLAVEELKKNPLLSWWRRVTKASASTRAFSTRYSGVRSTSSRSLTSGAIITEKKDSESASHKLKQSGAFSSGNVRTCTDETSDIEAPDQLPLGNADSPLRTVKLAGWLPPWVSM